MNQATCSTTNLQLHHNFRWDPENVVCVCRLGRMGVMQENPLTQFKSARCSRWVLCANHMEPVKGFLGRHLRRKLVEVEVMTNVRNNDLIKIIDWIPKVWQHLNKFLETHSSSDVTIGLLGQTKRCRFVKDLASIFPFLVFFRTSVASVVPYRHFRFPGMVHGSLELLCGTLSLGSSAWRASGNL